MFHTTNLKEFKLRIPESSVDKKKHKETYDLFKKRNFSELSPIVCNSKYEIYLESECVKYYAFKKYHPGQPLFYEFIDEPEMERQDELKEKHSPYNEDGKLMSFEEALGKYRRLKSHYNRLKELMDKYNLSVHSSVMLFGKCKNLKVFREGELRLQDEENIEILENILSVINRNKSYKDSKLKGKVMLPLLCFKLRNDPNFDIEQVLVLLKNNRIKYLGFGIRTVSHSMLELLKTYNDGLPENKKVINPMKDY